MSENEKLTREKFNFLKKYYDETWDENSHTLHVGLFKNDQDSLADSYRHATDYLINNAYDVVPITKKSVILDVGCGTGRTLVDVCLQYGCRGVGVDLSDEQINDAKNHISKINQERLLQGLPKIRAKFIRGSGSELDKTFKKDSQFTHIISQDAILLITNKQSLFRNILRLLVPGGIFAVADFLSESAPEERTESEENLIYKLVNWNEGLSFEAYGKILETIGLSVVKSERRDTDMINTYAKLAQKMEQHIVDGDKTYTELKERYESIVSAVKNGKMGWGFFFAKKSQKTALIAGAKEKSIGRFVASYLHKMGWNIWLYSRNARKVNKLYWHERKCDISSEKSIAKLLDEIQDLDLVMMLADTGGDGLLEELSEAKVKECMDAKLVGSVLLNKSLTLKFFKRSRQVKVIWCAGKPSKKSKDLILYSMVNSGLASYVDALNEHYKNVFEAYYLPTGLISPSTLGDDYIHKMGPELQKVAEHPQVIADMVQKIIDNEIEPGIINIEKNII
ncbi:MAG: SDR family NAD(P)-dependent oxidoreductase [bacterium]|nr:SDR family NAD(P)-dependent oxidoreductase [bacterium]